MSRPPAPASAPPGRRVRCAGGRTAFVPDPLPPELQWTPTLVRALSDADRLVGRLAGEGRRLPNNSELDRATGLHARQRDLCTAATGRARGLPGGVGEVPARAVAARPRTGGADARPVRGYPPVHRRQRTCRPLAHHALSGGAGSPARATPVPERLLRGDARRLL